MVEVVRQDKTIHLVRGSGKCRSAIIQGNHLARQLNGFSVQLTPVRIETAPTPNQEEYVRQNGNQQNNLQPEQRIVLFRTTFDKRIVMSEGGCFHFRFHCLVFIR